MYRPIASDFLAYRRLGDLCSTVFAMGLHQALPFKEDIPSFIIELRRRAFAAAYVADKAISTFLGRPPRISKKFSVCELPLDLSDEDLWLDGQQLQRAAERLDGRGWNVDRLLHQSTLTRVRALIAAIRDEVLEISLCTSVNDIGEQVR